MLVMNRLLLRLHDLAQDERAQDLAEYALLAGFVAVAAGATLPGVAEDLETIWRRLSKLLFVAAASGSTPNASRILQ